MAAVKLVTRCPACRTAFRVVADQLLLRQGLVRCGQCETVFDARAHLVEVPIRPSATAQPPSHAAQPRAHDPLPSSADTSTYPPARTGYEPTRAPEGQQASEPAGARQHHETSPTHDDDTGESDEPVRHEPPLPFDPGYDVPALDAPTMLLDLPDDSPRAPQDDEMQWDQPFPSIRLPDERDDGTAAPAHPPPPPDPAAGPAPGEHRMPDHAAGEMAATTEMAEPPFQHSPPTEAIFVEGKSTDADDDAGADGDALAGEADHDGQHTHHGGGHAAADGARERHEPAFQPESLHGPAPMPQPEDDAVDPQEHEHEYEADRQVDHDIGHENRHDGDQESSQAGASREEPVYVTGHYLRARDPDGLPRGQTEAAGDAGTGHAHGHSDRSADDADGAESSPTGTDRIEPRMRDYSRHDEPPIRLYAPDFLRHPATGEPEKSPDLPFGAAARRERSHGPGPRRRGWIWPVALVLGIAAVLQAGFLARSQLAGSFPALRPLLEAACAPLGCTVKPWRDIEALRIETSQLQKLDEGSDEYVLAVTLRNQGHADVALPAIELVMTDLQDQLLLRRVLPVEEYLAPDQRQFAVKGLRAGMELPVRVRFRTQQTAANYRVLILYP